jgi:capsular polysaccharide export protein
MMDSACKAFTETDLVVKMHPDHDLRRAKGILHGMIPPGVSVVPPGVNIWSVLNQVDEVYTVSSQVGFEALMAGKKVVCFGQPFYSGWGLTTDVASGRGSSRQLTLEQLVYGVLVKYPLYIHPERQEFCDIEEILLYLESAHLGDLGFYDRIYTVGLRPREKRALTEYLRGHLALDVNHISPKSARSRSYLPTEAVLYWEPREGHGDDLSYLESRGVSVLRAGLWPMDPIHGNRAHPNVLQITRNRLYYDGSPRNDLVRILEQAHFDSDLLRRAETIQQNFLAVLEQDSKNSFHTLDNHSVGRRIALVLGQGEGEGPLGVREKAVSTDHELLTKVRQDFPEAYILYAPPVGDSSSENHVLMPVDTILYDQLVRPEHTVSCYKLADTVHVVSAFRGIYALIYGKLLYTYGRPFYAGWGLTQDAEVFVGRSRQRSLIELLCATFILGPTYFNWVTRTSGTLEEAVRRHLATQSQEGPQPKVRTNLPIRTGRLSAWLGPVETLYRKMTAAKCWKKSG